jgi:hypothetical protein
MESEDLHQGIEETKSLSSPDKQPRKEIGLEEWRDPEEEYFRLSVLSLKM